MFSHAKRVLGAIFFVGAVGLLQSIHASGQLADSGEERASPEVYQKFSGAVALQNRDAFELAAESWTEFLDAHPDDALAPKARHYRGVCLLQLKKFDEAKQDFVAVIENSPDLDVVESTYVNLGLAYYNLAQANRDSTSENFKQAVATFQKQLKLFPRGEYAATAIYYQAEAFFALQKLSDAVVAYSQLVRDLPEHPLRPDALYGLGTAQYDLDEMDAATETFQKFLAEYASHALINEVRVRFGDALFAQGQFPAAEEQFAVAADAKEFDLADYALLRQAACRFESEDFAGAAQLYASLSSRFPNSPHAFTAALNAGKALLRAEQHADAAQWLRRAVAAGGTDSFEASHWLSRAELSAGRPTEALEAAEAALRSTPDKSWATSLAIDRADAMFATPQRRGEAADAYALAASTDPDNPKASEAYYLAADAALATSDNAKAKSFANKYLELYPNGESKIRVRHILAEAHLQLKEFPAAAGAFGSLISEFPDDRSLDVWRNRLALALSLEGKHGEVIQLLTPVIDGIQDPATLVESELMLGAALASTKSFDQAILHLRSAVARSRQFANSNATIIGVGDRARLQLARSLKGAGNLDDAIEALTSLLTESPESPLVVEARIRLADYHAANHDDQAALVAYRHILKNDQESRFFPNALVGAASASTRQGDVETAIKLLDVFLKKYPAHPIAKDALIARAIALQKNKNFDGAINDIAKYLELEVDESRRLDATYLRGLCLAGKQDYDSAIATLKPLLENDSEYRDKDRVLYEIAWAELDSGDAASAFDAFTRLATEFPNSQFAAEGHYRVAETNYEAGDFGAAAAAYTAAKSRSPKAPLSEKIQHKLAWAFFQQEKFDAAEEAFGEQLAQFADGDLAGDGLVMRGESQFKQGKFADALATYRASLGKQPSSELFRVTAYLHGGQAAGQLSKWEESRQLLEQCANAHPNSELRDEVDYELGWALHQLGHDDAAKDLFTRVAAKNDTVVGARARFMIGEIEMARKRYAEAVKTLFQVAYGYGYPNAPEAFHALQVDAMFDAARCLEQLNKRDSALKVYREIVDGFPESENADHARKRIQEIEAATP